MAEVGVVIGDLWRWDWHFEMDGWWFDEEVKIVNCHAWRVDVWMMFG